MSKKIEISIIIPTKNRDTYLKKALLSLTKQDFNNGDTELIVIDNGPVGKTRELVESFKNQIPNISYFVAPIPGLFSVRHMGLTKARGTIVAYLDDDIVLFPDWLRTIRKLFYRYPNLAMLGGRCLPLFEGRKPKWLNEVWGRGRNLKVLAQLSIVDLGPKRKKINPKFIFGCNFIIRKGVIFLANGFHPDVMDGVSNICRGDGETHISYFVNKHKLLALYDLRVSVWHYVTKERATPEYIIKRAYDQGIEYSYTHLRRHGFRVSEIFFITLGLTILSLFKKNAINRSIYQEMLNGYLDHCNKVLETPALYDWVYRKNYIEYPYGGPLAPQINHEHQRRNRIQLIVFSIALIPLLLRKSAKLILFHGRSKTFRNNLFDL